MLLHSAYKRISYRCYDSFPPRTNFASNGLHPPSLQSRERNLRLPSHSNRPPRTLVSNCLRYLFRHPNPPSLQDTRKGSPVICIPDGRSAASDWHYAPSFCAAREMGRDGYYSGNFGVSGRGDGWFLFVEIGGGYEGAFSCAAWGVYFFVGWISALSGDLDQVRR